MAKAVTCPVCYGSGRVPNDVGVGADKKPCHGCGGNGWVEVAEDSLLPYITVPYDPTTLPPWDGNNNFWEEARREF